MKKLLFMLIVTFLNLANAKTQRFDCSPKYCGEMSGCAEACYHFIVCKDSARDRDGDGVPCEGNRNCMANFKNIYMPNYCPDVLKKNNIKY